VGRLLDFQSLLDPVEEELAVDELVVSDGRATFSSSDLAHVTGWRNAGSGGWDGQRFAPPTADDPQRLRLDREARLELGRGGRRLGPPPPARGPLAHVRGGRHQHRRGALHRLAPDVQEPLRRRGWGHAGAQGRLNRLRSIDAVFDAYRVTPTGG
jgi:hypothetical protein